MRARLTLKTNKDSGFYYNTVCDLEIEKRSAQIVFKEIINKEKCLLQIGLSAGKILIHASNLNENDQIDRSEPAQLYVLTQDSCNIHKIVLELSACDLFLTDDNMSVKIAKNKVSARVRCFFLAEDKRSEETILNLTCLPIENLE